MRIQDEGQLRVRPGRLIGDIVVSSSGLIHKFGSTSIAPERTT